jgi:DNA-directed RNA polymerase subunit RPC12/RpoP
MSLANNKALSCSNCGGQLEYNYTQEISKCLYCGSEFKKDKPKREPQDKADQKPRFVEKPVTIPEENKVIYDMVFSPRPKFWKAFLWDLVPGPAGCLYRQ